MKLAHATPGPEENLPTASDAELAAAGDRRAFERLYHANLGRVYSLALRMTGNRERAEELTQDVFVRAWERLGQFRGESLFSTWIHRLAVNLILNALKADRRDDRRFDQDSEGMENLPLRARLVGEKMDLENAIMSLPKGARVVFVLYDVEGYQHSEIGDMLGITAGGSKAQLHRARMLLRRALER
jgi:RNA polymerase sigma-70 factor (ECF subfamily)